MIYGIIINRGITLLRQFKCIVMRCVMDIKMLTKRYRTPVFAKGLGSILFIAVVVLMIALPVFELIPQSEYINVFNLSGSAKGDYSSTTYTIFTMMENDYGSGLAMGIMLTQCIISAVAGVALLWMNRPKFAAIPASLILWTVIFSVFRATQTGVNKDVPAKLFTGPEFWTNINKNVASVDGNIDVDAKDTFVQQYTKDGTDYIFNTLRDYWILWVAGIVLLAFVIFSIVVTKTLVQKKKK